MKLTDRQFVTSLQITFSSLAAYKHSATLTHKPHVDFRNELNYTVIHPFTMTAVKYPLSYVNGCINKITDKQGFCFQDVKPQHRHS
jgi:hypothetical protein